MDDLRILGLNAPVKRGRIGEVLLEMGALDRAGLDAALAVQRGSPARLGEIIAARGLAAPGAVTAAAARQIGARRADLAATPLDPDLLDPADLPIYLAHRMAPWRRVEGGVGYVAADHDLALRGLAALTRPPGRVELALADGDEIAAAMTRAHGPLLAARAAGRAPLAQSARAPVRPGWRLALAASLAALAAGAALAPVATLGAAFLALATINGFSGLFRIAVLGRALRPLRDPAPADFAGGAVPLAARRRQPRITLLIPLLDEPETLPVLLNALERLDWPRELLDVKLILEPEDARTRDALAALEPPPFCHVLTVPPGGPRTKPRALNYGLDFAEGDIVGVYDAEDRPEPDQLRRVADILRAAPPEVACVQCRLAYYNPRENWLTRCFAIEYAIWFDVLLAGFRDLRLPIPLGGTSVFFRRATLLNLGGWDAHNVTEDADLGVRLARAGLRTEICASTTHEEAASRPGQWLRQRSRWLKGYMTTWAVHMRRPARLARDLGLWGFLGFQVVFLGAATAYLGLPLFWLVWGLSLAGAAPAWVPEAPTAVIAALVVSQSLGWGAMVVAAAAATARRGERWLWPWIPSLLLYWPLGAAAAYLALVELVVAPRFWRKTRHGLGRLAAAQRAAALRQRADARPAPDQRAAR